MSRLPALMKLHDADPADADLLFMIGSEHANEGRPGDALAWLSRYVERGRDVGAGYGLIADCCLKLGQDAQAQAALKQGIEAARRAGHPTMAAEFEERLEEMG
jgi:predicted Zn-dependent protease